MARVCIVAKKPLKWNYRIQRQAKELASSGHDVTLLALEAPTGLENSKNINIITVDTAGVVAHGIRYHRSKGPVQQKLIKGAVKTYGTAVKWIDRIKGLDEGHGYDFRGVLYRLQGQYRGPLLSRLFLKEVPERLYQWDFDVVQVHDSFALDAGVKIAKETNARLVADVVELATERTASDPAPETKITKIVNLTWFRRMYDKFDDTIAVGNGVASWTAENLQIEKPTIVRNCRPASFRDVEPPYEVREETPIPDDAYLCVFAGSIRKTISVDSLLRAITRLDTPVQVALVGPGQESDYANHLRETADELNISDRLHFQNPVDAHEVPATIMSADFGFHGLDDSSLNNIHALPNKFFEYVTAQIPLAVPDYPDMGGLTKEYSMGVTFEDAEPEAIAYSLKELFDNYDHYQENVVAASEELTWANEAEKYRAVIEEQAAKSSKKRPAFQWIDGDRGSVENPEAL